MATADEDDGAAATTTTASQPNTSSADSPSPRPDAISAVLASTNHFAALSLPLPFLNVLGEVDWAPLSDPGSVQRAFRSASLLVHPDKHREHAAEAQAAFDRLVSAQKALSTESAARAYCAQFLATFKADSAAVSADLRNVVEVEREKARLRKRKADAFQARLSATMAERAQRAADDRLDAASERAIWGPRDVHLAAGDDGERGAEEQQEGEVDVHALRVSIIERKKQKRHRSGAF